MRLHLIITMTLVVGTACAQQQGRFDQWDVNKDGKLTRDELPERLRGNFERVDRNNDGVIDRAEDAAVGQRKRRPVTERALPASVKLMPDISYAGTDNSRQMLDLILPKVAKSDRLPVVVFVHGGGWRNGNKSSKLQIVAKFAATGEYAAASIGYRLSGEATWPSQIHDCKAAIRWLRANADKHGLDADRIAVWGSSAGGHLVAMLGTSGDVAAMDGTLGPHTDVSSRVSCVVDYFGPTNLLLMNKTAIKGAKMDHDAPDSPESLLLGGPVQENTDKAKTANPITYVTKDDPPFLIVHGTVDPLVSFNQSELLHAALKKTGASTTLVTVEGAGHGKGFGRDVDATVQRFFEHHLLGRKSEWRDTKTLADHRRR
jgi:acetyl esterase/lipase